MTDGHDRRAAEALEDIRRRDQVVQLNVAPAKRTQEERDRSVLLGLVDDLIAKLMREARSNAAARARAGLTAATILLHEGGSVARVRSIDGTGTGTTVSLETPSRWVSLARYSPEMLPAYGWHVMHPTQPKSPRSCDKCEDGVVRDEYCPTCDQGIPRTCTACNGGSHG